ncbi:MAG TPA: hypothetical protein VHE33_10160 [Acidobacteriaceae bacterium]|nr:hypothetical protein [Acidobacteriaceae bacterium]
MAAGLRCIVVLLIAATTAPLYSQARAETAHDLVRDVIYNELHDREHDSHWQYRSECVSSTQNVVREQVETDEGPIFRLLARNGNPLDAAQQDREDARLAEYLQSPAQIAKVDRDHQEDESRLAGMMELLPQAFLFEYQGGPDGHLQRIAFRPNPAFVPASYEARIVHALAGTFTVDVRTKRMVEMRGTVAERVEFGYGLLGHVEKGGTFDIHRRQVSAEHWKTDLVDVHVQGKILMLKTVGKDEREARSDFRPVPVGTTLEQAREMLNETVDRQTRARLVQPGNAAKGISSDR